MKRILFSLTIVLLLSGCSDKQLTKVVANDHVIDVELAVTNQEKYQGLSNRVDMCHNCGMLFFMAPNSLPEFVMRDMKFDLDFVWIDDNIIVDIIENAPAEGSETTVVYKPSSPADYVLEINAGLVKELGWQIGSNIDFIYE